MPGISEWKRRQMDMNKKIDKEKERFENERNRLKQSKRKHLEKEGWMEGEGLAGWESVPVARPRAFPCPRAYSVPVPAIFSGFARIWHGFLYFRHFFPS